MTHPNPIALIDNRLDAMLERPGMHAIDMGAVESVVWLLLDLREQLHPDLPDAWDPNCTRRLYNKLKRNVGVSGSGIVAACVGPPLTNRPVLDFYREWAEAVRVEQDGKISPAIRALQNRNLEALARLSFGELSAAVMSFDAATQRELCAAWGVSPENILDPAGSLVWAVAVAIARRAAAPVTPSGQVDTSGGDLREENGLKVGPVRRVEDHAEVELQVLGSHPDGVWIDQALWRALGRAGGWT